jgi:hypothetical protein
MSGIRRVALLGDADAPALALAAGMAKAWGLAPCTVTGLDAPYTDDRADGFLAAVVDGRRAPPAFAVDLARGQPGLALVRELLDRLHIPVVTTSPVGVHGSLHVAAAPLTARTESELWQAFRALATEPQETLAATLKPAWSDLESERSWAWIARYCATVFENSGAQFA